LAYSPVETSASSDRNHKVCRIQDSLYGYSTYVRTHTQTENCV